MKKTTEQTFCDLCKKEATVQTVSYPVIVVNYLINKKYEKFVDIQFVDICSKCYSNVMKIYADKTDGNWQYSIKGD